jgi:hypothetical protein
MSQGNSANEREDLNSEEKSQYVFETVEVDEDDLEDPYSSELKI